MSQCRHSEPPFPLSRYPDDPVVNCRRLVASETRVLKAGPPEGASLQLYVQAKLKGSENAKFKAHFSGFFVSSLTISSFLSQSGDNYRFTQAYFQG